MYSGNDGSGGAGGGTESLDKLSWSGQRGFINGINGDMSEEELHKKFSTVKANTDSYYYWSAGYSMNGRWEKEGDNIVPKGNERLKGGDVSSTSNYGAGGRRVLWRYR